MRTMVATSSSLLTATGSLSTRGASARTTPSHDMHRLAKLCRQLGPLVPAMTRYHFFVTRWVSLGKKTPLQALHRGRRYAWALRKADGVADEHMPPTI